MISACYRDGVWLWGGRAGSNSISDAEQLLCLLYPATEIPTLALDRPDDMADDVLAALRALASGPPGDPDFEWLLERSGPAAVVGEALVGLLETYIETYTDIGGDPIFAAGSYLRTSDESGLEEQQLAVEVVDSYSMSLTLSIASLGFLRVFLGFVRAQAYPEANQLNERINVLTGKISHRLTAAMIGLLRSFVVNTIAPGSTVGQTIIGMLNQAELPTGMMIENINRALEPVRTQLRSDVTLAQTPGTKLWRDDMLFECGWSWGVVQKAGALDDYQSFRIAGQEGIGDPRPYLYFTIIALDGINDLTSQRTRKLDLLDDTQRKLAESLQIRWYLTQQYWSTVARFGPGRWPLEDIPWRTSDGEESDYFSAMVSAVLIQDLVGRTANEDDLSRAVTIFDELCRRGRITRRATRDDPAVALHSPGVPLSLVGTEKAGGVLLQWVVADYAAVLLKRVLQAARLSGDVTARDRLLELAKSIMDHLHRRKMSGGTSDGLWDYPARAFERIEAREEDALVSWYMTERMIECLVTADRTYRSLPLRPPTMVNRAVELLNEAEHLLNQEWLGVILDDTSGKRQALEDVEQQLDRARTLVDEKPGTAVSIATMALIRLEELAYARLDATRSF